jgi:hypothetical protein
MDVGVDANLNQPSGVLDREHATRDSHCRRAERPQPFSVVAG